MILNAHGKINLSLDITGRREDGYHYVSMVMQSVALCDVVSVDKNSSGAVFVKSDNPEVPDGQENLAYKACELMISQFCLNCGFDVFIQKHIPVAGGMAGGSTDAAAVMKAVNHLCGLAAFPKTADGAWALSWCRRAVLHPRKASLGHWNW